MCMEKSLVNSQQYIIISMDISGKGVMGKIKRCKTRTKHINQSICSLIGVDAQVTEILKPTSIPKGLRLEMYIYVNVEDNKVSDLKNVLENAVANGELASIIDQHWKLQNVPFISNLSIESYESKDQRTINGQSTITATHNSIQMSNTETA